PLLCHVLSSSLTRRPPTSTLSPYTTLFRSETLSFAISRPEPPCKKRSRIVGDKPHALKRGPTRCPMAPAQATPYNARPMAKQKKDRKSTRLNSSHVKSSYAVFCLKKKTAMN